MATVSVGLLARQRAIARLSGAPLDLLVVGGGIVGAGVARDAAMRGLDVGLVEQYDFASGTSSRSSHLVARRPAVSGAGLPASGSRSEHGEAGPSPHCPAPGRAVGVRLSDPARLAMGPLEAERRRENLRSAVWPAQSGQVEHARPLADVRVAAGVDAQAITGAVRYYDGLTNDARLVIDTLRSAVHHGAAVAN